MKTLSQIDLVVAITEHLRQAGYANATVPQLNVVIQAADLIIDAFSVAGDEWAKEQAAVDAAENETAKPA